MTIMIMLDSAGRKRTLSCSTTATAHSSASSYTSYNMDNDDADHMIYLESRSITNIHKNCVFDYFIMFLSPVFCP